MEFDHGSPIWLQLVSEFSRRIATGEWAVGARIPGVRELALQLGVNPNTVQRTLAEMDRDGLSRTERSSGRFVTHDSSRVAALRRELFTEAADEYIRLGRGLHMDVADALTLIDERWHRSDNAITDPVGTEE